MTGQAPLPPELDRPEVLGFIATMLAWREGDEAPVPPTTLGMTVPELVTRLEDPEIRAGVVRRLSVLVQPPPNRAARRRRR